MSLKLMAWDHCRYVKNKEKPYDEMARHLEKCSQNGLSLMNVYMPEVISLDDYCRAAKANGIEVEARIFPAWNNPAPICRTLTAGQWTDMENEFGIKLAGTCGNSPKNRENFVKIADALTEEYKDRIVSLHLDFIRNDNALTQLDYPCACEACRSFRKRFFGFEVPSPAQRRDPAILYKELEFRNRNITEMVCDVRKITNKRGLGLSIAARANYINSLDITAPPVWGLGPAVIEGQDWVQWAEDGLVDAVYPMNYHTDFMKFKSVLSDHIRLLNGTKVKLYPGIGVSSSMGVNSPSRIADYLQLVEKRGLNGVVFFNKTNIYSDDYFAVFKRYGRACENDGL